MYLNFSIELRQDLSAEKAKRLAAECDRQALRQIQQQTSSQLSAIHHRVAELELTSTNMSAQLTASKSENESLMLLQDASEQAILAEKEARIQVEEELEKEVDARRKMEGALASVDLRVLPTLAKAMEKIGELTDRVLA